MSDFKFLLSSGAAACVMVAVLPGFAWADEGMIEADGPGAAGHGAHYAAADAGARLEAARTVSADAAEKTTPEFTLSGQRLMAQLIMTQPLLLSSPKNSTERACFEVSRSGGPLGSIHSLRCGSGSYADDTFAYGSVAFGGFARAWNSGSAIGFDSAAGPNSVAFGASSRAGKVFDDVLGEWVDAGGSGVAVGWGSSATALRSTAVGASAWTDAANTTVVGSQAWSNAPFSSVFGNDAYAQAFSGTVVGNSALVTGDSGVAIGGRSNNDGIIFRSAMASGPGAIALGSGAWSGVNGAAGTIAIGHQAEARETGSIYIGSGWGGTETLGSLQYGGAYSIGMGWLAHAPGINAIAFGANAVSSANDTLAIGASSQATGLGALAFGASALSTGERSVALGANAQSTARHAVSIGRGATASGSNSFALGAFSNAGQEALAIGAVSQATGLNSVAVGRSAAAGGENALAMGLGANASARNGVAIGQGAEASGANGFAMGAQSVAGPDGLAIGALSQASGTRSVAIGRDAVAGKVNAVAIGWGARADFDNSFALGAGATTSFAGQFLLGTAASFYSLPGLGAPANLISIGDAGADFVVVSDTSGNLKSINIGEFAASGTSNSSGGAVSTSSNSSATSPTTAMGAGPGAGSTSADASAVAEAASGGESAEVAALRAQVEAMQAQMEAMQAMIMGGNSGTAVASAALSGEAGSDAASPPARNTFSRTRVANAAPSAQAQALYSQNAAAIAANSSAITALQVDVQDLRNDFEVLGEGVRANTDSIRINRDGVAVALAMSGIGGLQNGETFALSANYGLWDGSHALAFAGAARFSERVSLNGGVGFGTETGEVGARAGVRMGW